MHGPSGLNEEEIAQLRELLAERKQALRYVSAGRLLGGAAKSFVTGLVVFTGLAVAFQDSLARLATLVRSWFK